jgi:hypothetical protein
MTPIPEAVAAPIETEACWRPERFYWAVLDSHGWRRGGVLPEGFRSALEEEVPCEPGALHAVCAPIAGDQLVVCAAERAELERLEPGTLTLTPESIPAVTGDTPVASGDLDPACLNLLIGPYEPLQLRRSRLRRHLAAAATLVLCSALVSDGLVRRASHWRSIAESASGATSAALARVSLDEKALAMEEGRLRRVSESLTAAHPAEDASLALADLLRAWPKGVHCETQSLTVAQTEATASVSVEGDPAPFLEAFTPPKGWRLEEPRLTAAASTTHLALRLHRDVGVGAGVGGGGAP